MVKVYCRYKGVHTLPEAGASGRVQSERDPEPCEETGEGRGESGEQRSRRPGGQEARRVEGRKKKTRQTNG